MFLQGPQRLTPGQNMDGFAYTLRDIPSREDLDQLRCFEVQNNAQRKGIEECPDGAFFVIDARSDASAGSGGLVTLGGIRDTPEISQLDMPANHQCASAPTNLTKHHAVAINDPIACGGVAIYPNDIRFWGQRRCCLYPAHLAKEIADDANEMTVHEQFVLHQVQQGASTFGLYPITDDDIRDQFKTWRQKMRK